MSTPSGSTSLNAQQRTRALQEVGASADDTNSKVDLVVIGGGITGTGIALDAATRGMSVVLLERNDLGHGTSRWSSKLAHGGLRYLTKPQFGIAHNSAVERGIIMEHTAPHLVHALPQVTFLADNTSLVQKAAMRVGFLAGDFLRVTAGTSGKTLPRSRFINAKKAVEMCPTGFKQGLKGAWVNYDGQMVDDARFVTAVARTAAGYGAKIITRAEVTNATGDQVTFTDTLHNEEYTINARAVINATGVWAGQLDENIKVRPARGTHLVLDAEKLGNPEGALTVPLGGSISRYLFILPAPHRRCYLGLTDEDNGDDIPDVPYTGTHGMSDKAPSWFSTDIPTLDLWKWQ
ncbi:FAD-dependent oxidoreductase [Corynebacterium camporealensis]|uniref:FAD-dependent oxidoreductase n=1 Tax=Corynebacterium camporealensis TaxID=161896 RepID=UPI0034CFE53C